LSTVPLPIAATDQSIIAQVLAGQVSEFAVLVRRYNQRLFRAARAVTRTDMDAEDALQQAWMEIYRHLDKFRSEAAFSTWATRIAVNEGLSISRRRPLLGLVHPGAQGEDPAQDLTERTAPQPTMTTAERSQIGKLMEQCLERIPQGNREVMILRDVLEFDTAETAAFLGLSEEAVRVRLHRARAAVAAQLDEVVGEHVRTLYGFDGARCDRVTAAVMCNVLAVARL
jgi:RNA polymerase sigma-70 factor (ECF subfamily)